MKRTPARRSSLFLLECIIAILFFILTATVCVSFFAKAYSVSKDSEDLSMAVQIVSSYAEEFRSKTCCTQIRDNEFVDSMSKIYFDNSWTECDVSNASHTLTITITTQDGIVTGHFQMDHIFETSLDVYRGVQLKGGAIR